MVYYEGGVEVGSPRGQSKELEPKRSERMSPQGADKVAVGAKWGRSISTLGRIVAATQLSEPSILRMAPWWGFWNGVSEPD